MADAAQRLDNFQLEKIMTTLIVVLAVLATAAFFFWRYRRKIEAERTVLTQAAVRAIANAKSQATAEVGKTEQVLAHDVAGAADKTDSVIKGL